MQTYRLFAAAFRCMAFNLPGIPFGPFTVIPVKLFKKS